MLTLVGGGARSGKSNFALKRARDFYKQTQKKVLFIATAQAQDEEMKARIEIHQKERDDFFELIEEPVALAQAIKDLNSDRLVIVDCLTLWLSNCLYREIEPDHLAVIEAAQNRIESTIFVTNEVGEGIVPMHPVSREFRDASGRMNQMFAKHCDEVIYMKFGLEMKLK